MSWRLPTGTSNIAANTEVGLAPETYFTAGDKAAIASRISAILDGPERVDYSDKMKRYDWDTIAASTAEFYHSILSGRRATQTGF
jgi:glycosyltransferase involved in cell wall biosynthesis